MQDEPQATYTTVSTPRGTDRNKVYWLSRYDCYTNMAQMTCSAHAQAVMDGYEVARWGDC